MKTHDPLNLNIVNRPLPVIGYDLGTRFFNSLNPTAVIVMIVTNEDDVTFDARLWYPYRTAVVRVGDDRGIIGYFETRMTMPSYL
jgi:hypothetical protein